MHAGPEAIPNQSRFNPTHTQRKPNTCQSAAKGKHTRPQTKTQTNQRNPKRAQSISKPTRRQPRNKTIPTRGRPEPIPNKPEAKQTQPTANHTQPKADPESAHNNPNPSPHKPKRAQPQPKQTQCNPKLALTVLRDRVHTRGLSTAMQLKVYVRRKVHKEKWSVIAPQVRT